MVSIKQPNSLCKNEKCRKPFYACAYCTRTNAWRAVACSIECFNAYTEQVMAARAAKKKINLLPDRTDMTDEQMAELMAKPIDEVMEMTREELKDYSGSIAEIVTQINDEIDVDRAGTHEKIMNPGVYSEILNEDNVPAPATEPQKGRRKKTEDGSGKNNVQQKANE